MRPSNHPGRIIPRDTAPGDAMDEVLADLPFSRDEVDDLLFGSDQRPSAERLDRLRELAEHLRVRAAGDFGNGDVASLLGEVEDAIGEIEAGERTGGIQGIAGDPADHRETLSPDSDELEEIEEEDEESLDGLRRLDGAEEDEIGQDDEDDEDDED